MWGSYYNIPKAIFYLLKGDYRSLLVAFPFKQMGAVRLEGLVQARWAHS